MLLGLRGHKGVVRVHEQRLLLLRYVRVVKLWMQVHEHGLCYDFRASWAFVSFDAAGLLAGTTHVAVIVGTARVLDLGLLVLQLIGRHVSLLADDRRLVFVGVGRDLAVLLSVQGHLRFIDTEFLGDEAVFNYLVNILSLSHSPEVTVK